MIAADELMVLAGYYAQLGTSTLSIWPLFFIGCIAQVVVFGQLYAYLPTNDTNNQSRNPLYNFLFIWILIVWNLVTAVRRDARRQCRLHRAARLTPARPRPPARARRSWCSTS